MPDHQWKFIRAGGVDQVVIRSGADVVNLDQLDQKLWVALACPTRGLEFDTRTLDLIDTDSDGRIRPPELIAATHWVRDRLKDPDVLVAEGDCVPLAALDASTPPGDALAAEARHTLATLGKAGVEAICLADIAERQRRFAGLPFNGDGVIRAASTDDEALSHVIGEIADTQGTVQDLSGEPGIDRARTTAFFDEASALERWRRDLDACEGALPLGEDSVAAVDAVDAVCDKVEDYYTRTRLAAYDPAAAAALAPAPDDYRRIGGDTLDAGSEAVAALPLADIAPGRALPLVEGVNPAWAERLHALRTRAAEPLLGRPLTELTEDDWRSVREKLGVCARFLREKPKAAIEKLGIPRLRELLAGDLRERVEALIAEDERAREQRALVDDLEKLVRFKRDLVPLLNNFVSFSSFYGRHGAIFQAGTLYLDARSCDLTVHVGDAGKHAALAGLAKTFLVYCECTRPNEKMTIVSAFTAGDVDYLLVGRNGVFYDRKGRDWDAHIVKVIENPISVRQAFALPYKKFLRAIEEQVAKRAAASESKAQGGLSSLAAQAANPDKQPAPRAQRGLLQRRVDVGTVAAIGVALGSIGTLLVAVFTKLIDLGWWIPVAFLGVMLAISGPSMAIAWLKLRQRSLGPILDASGWAINGRMRINVALGASLSKTPHIPPGSQRRLRDPYADRHTGRYLLLLFVVIAGAAYAAWRLELWPAAAPRLTAPVEAPAK